MKRSQSSKEISRGFEDEVKDYVSQVNALFLHSSDLSLLAFEVFKLVYGTFKKVDR